jgi:hypothetical protein
MASLCSKGDSKYIIFYRNKKRQPLIYLGDVSNSVAKKMLGYVEDLITAKSGGVSASAV